MKRISTRCSHLLLLSCSYLLMSYCAWGQKVSSKNAKTKYLNYPMVSVNDVKSYRIVISKGPLNISEGSLQLSKKKRNKLGKDVSARGYFSHAEEPYKITGTGADVTIQLCFGPFAMVGKNMKDHEVPCKKSSDKTTVDNIKQCPAFYYNVKFTLPCILRIKGADGKVLYAEQLGSATMQDSVLFGYQKMGGYLYTKDLKAAWEKNGASSVQSMAFSSYMRKATFITQDAFYFSYDKEKLQVFTGGGKNDYKDLNQALGSAITAYDKHSKDGLTADVTKGLKEATGIWENAVKEINMDDNKARINRKIGTMLYFNLGTAYMYMGQWDDAKRTAAKAVGLSKFMGNMNRKAKILELFQKVSMRAVASTANPGVKIPDKKYGAPVVMLMARKSKKDVNINFIDPNNESFSSCFDSYKDFAGAVADAMASGGGNTGGSGGGKYAARVEKNSLQGYVLALNPFVDKLSDLPVEICEISHLNQILAVGLKMKSIPVEIGNLEKLEVLNLNGNQLSVLPEEIGNCSNLRKLMLKKNNLSKLPASLSKLSKLEVLELTGNSILASDVAALQKQLPNCKIKNK